MKRSLCLVALALNKNEHAQPRPALKDYGNVKHVLVGIGLSCLSSCELHSLRSVRESVMSSDLYPERMGVHLVDQALSDITIADICVRHFESWWARDEIRTRIWRLSLGESEHHDACSRLEQHIFIDQIVIMSALVSEMVTVTIPLAISTEVPRIRHHVVRKAIGDSWPGVANAPSIPLDGVACEVVDAARVDVIYRANIQVVYVAPHGRILLSLLGILLMAGAKPKRAFICTSPDALPLPRVAGPVLVFDLSSAEVGVDDLKLCSSNACSPKLFLIAERQGNTGITRSALHALSKTPADFRRGSPMDRHKLETKTQQGRPRRSAAQLQAASGLLVRELRHAGDSRNCVDESTPRFSGQRPPFILSEAPCLLRAKHPSFSRLCASWARNVKQRPISVHAYSMSGWPGGMDHMVGMDVNSWIVSRIVDCELYRLVHYWVARKIQDEEVSALDGKREHSARCLDYRSREDYKKAPTRRIIRGVGATASFQFRLNS